MDLPDAADHGTTTHCARHPGTETRLHCSNCGRPICPRCQVATVVGQKCPACARPERGARRRGKPQQYVKAVLFGVPAAGLAGVVLHAFFTEVGFLTLISSGLAGYAVARAVDLGAERNRATPFLVLAISLSVLTVGGAWVIGFGIVVPQSINALTYPAAVYGAFLVHRR